jgi:hypothetical protein
MIAQRLIEISPRIPGIEVAYPSGNFAPLETVVIKQLLSRLEKACRKLTAE